jgi:hypothetical protein
MPAQAAAPVAVESHYLQMLPQLQKFAYVRHRYLSPEERQEAIAETCAWGWQWCLRAFEKGTLNELNVRMISLYASGLYRAGRRFAGASTSDAFAPHSGCSVLRIGTGKEDSEGNPRSVGAILTDSRHPRPMETVRRNIDYAIAMHKPVVSRKGRACFRHLLKDHSRGHGRRIAKTMHLSNARISQLKGQIGEALVEIGYGPGPRPAA